MCTHHRNDRFHDLLVGHFEARQGNLTIKDRLATSDYSVLRGKPDSPGLYVYIYINIWLFKYVHIYMNTYAHICKYIQVYK